MGNGGWPPGHAGRPGAGTAGLRRCYGTAGLARAQQLAGLALGDTARQVGAETALVTALTDPAHLRATTDPGLCHGFAGLAHVAARTAEIAHPSTAGRLRAAIPPLLAAACPPETATGPGPAADALVHGTSGPGFLDGAAGMALGLLGATTTPSTAWDSCLLLA